MWRSMAARSSVIRYLRRNLLSSQTLQSQVPPKTQMCSSYSSNFTQHSKLPHQNCRFFSQSSISEFESETHDATSSEEVESENVGVSGVETHVDKCPEKVGLTPELGENDGNSDAQMSDLSSFIQELVKEADGEAVITEMDGEKIENVLFLLQSTIDGSLQSSLDRMNLGLNEEFVMRVLETPLIPGEHLLGFFKWAMEKKGFELNTRVLGAMASAICGGELKRKDAYALWDLIKEAGGKDNGVVNSEILNQLILLFSRLGKGKAAFEVFGKFEELGCVPNVDTYYLTIEALCKRSFYDWAVSVCHKMLDAGMVPEGGKVGEIISFFCKGRREREAHVVYLAAKEKDKCPPQKPINFLISCLSKENESVHLAQQMLVDFSGEIRTRAISPFSWVVGGLCRKQDIEGAKKLLLEMIEKGPPPGNAVFNSVINSLSKAGDLDDAKKMLKLMESRGLKPDVYTYSVIMSGYAKGGLMEEAYEVLSEAKQKHKKLCPVTFHTLIRGYCKLGEFDKALNLLSEMKDCGVEPNVDEYNKLIQSLCLKALDWGTAEKLLEELKEKGLHLPGITRSLVKAVKELEQEAAVSEDAVVTA